MQDPSPAYQWITGKKSTSGTPTLPDSLLALGYSIGPTGTIQAPPTATASEAKPGVAAPVAPNLPGAPASNYSSPYGGIPQVPSPIATAQGAISGNIANLPSIFDLAKQLNAFSNSQAVLPYLGNLPGYTGMLGQASRNATSLLQGKVPMDVWQQMAQRGAERGVGMGSPSSPNANSALMQALGLTSLGLQQQGLGNFQTLMGLTPVGQQFNPATMLVSPEQMQSAQAAANLYKAAPVPADKAAADLNAALAGLGAGRSSVAPSGYVPFSSGSGTQLPSYATQPTAPGVAKKPTPSVGIGLLTPQPQAPQAPQAPSVQDLLNQGPYPGGEATTFPGLENYPYVPGFESLPPEYALSQGEPYYGPYRPGTPEYYGAGTVTGIETTGTEEQIPGFESLSDYEDIPGPDASLQEIYDWLGV